jgi:hypothetical protein
MISPFWSTTWLPACLLTEKPFLTRIFISRSPDITGSLADICQLHFQDLGILNQKLLAEYLQNKPDRLLDVHQGFLFRLALTYGPRQFEASDSVTSFFLRFEDDCVLHRDNGW